MSGFANSVRVGNVNGTPIVGDLSNGVRGTPETLVRVTLTNNYTMENPPGYPSRPNVGGSTPFYPHTLASGGTYGFLQPEAAALVGAGAATYA